MLRVFCFAIGLLASMPAYAVSVFNFQGDPFDEFFGGSTVAGPITGSITFAPMPLIPGSTLTTSDVVDFSFSVDGFVFDFATSSFFSANFDVVTPKQFSSYLFTAERELLDTADVGPEQISLLFGPSFNLQSFVVGDGLSNSSSTVTSAASSFLDFGSATTTPTSNFTPAVIPLPATAWFLASGLMGLGLMKRRRAEREAANHGRHRTSAEALTAKTSLA
ncbi:MAG: VPLPA-CTERM sorting domain-containing protein [Pseudomonadota bacterium]